MESSESSLRWSSIGKFDNGIGANGASVAVEGPPLLPPGSSASEASTHADDDPLLKPNQKWEEMMKRLDGARSRLLDDSPPPSTGSPSGAPSAPPLLTEDCPRPSHHAAGTNHHPEDEPILLLGGPSGSASRAPGSAPHAADSEQPPILLPSGPSQAPPLPRGPPIDDSDDEDDRSPYMLHSSASASAPKQRDSPPLAIAQGSLNSSTPTGDRYSDLMNAGSPSSSRGASSPAAIPPPGASESPVMTGASAAAAATKDQPPASSPLGLPPASAAPEMPFPPGDFLGQALMSSPLNGDGGSSGAAQDASDEEPTPALLRAGSREESRRDTRESEAPSFSHGVGASSFGEIFDYQQESLPKFDGGSSGGEIQQLTERAREAEPPRPRSATTTSTSLAPAMPSWYNKRPSAASSSSQAATTSRTSSSRRTYTYTSPPQQPYSSPPKAPTSTSYRTRGTSPLPSLRSYGSPSRRSTGTSPLRGASPLRTSLRTTATSPPRRPYSPPRRATSTSPGLQRTAARATSTSPPRRPSSPVPLRASSPPSPRSSSPSGFSMSTSSLKTRIEDDMAVLVRRVLSESHLRGSPTRLELRMVAQEMAAQVQGYFSKLEASLPAKLSYEDERGGLSAASETLSARLDAVGAGLRSSAAAANSNTYTSKSYGGGAAQASPPRPWSSPPSRPAPISFESWKYSDRSPPRRSPDAASRPSSALDSFTKKWQAMGKGTDGRPLSPSARLRQEKLRLAQRSADLMDEKLQAYGISPVRASRHYPVGSPFKSPAATSSSAAAFRRASSPSPSPSRSTAGGASADILERLRRIEAGLSNSFRSARLSSPTRAKAAGFKASAAAQTAGRSPSAGMSSSRRFASPGEGSRTFGNFSRPLSSPAAGSGARLREAWSRTTEPGSPRPTSPGLDRLRRVTANLKSSTTDFRGAGREQQQQQPPRRDWTQRSDGLGFSKENSRQPRDSPAPKPVERRLTLSKFGSSTSSTQPLSGRREATGGRQASQGRVLGSAYEFLRSPTSGGSGGSHSTLRLLPSALGRETGGRGPSAAPSSGDRIALMAAEIRRRHP